MIDRLLSLEYNLTHPYPHSRWFLLATVLVFLLVLPALIVLNLATLGSELVPSLQSTFQPNDTLLEGWWGTGRLPPWWRPRAPPCQPQDLGRGDTFQLSPSLFDYKVQSVWNTTKALSASGVREQERVEYRGQSFSGCFVNTTRFDYNMIDQTQTLSVGVICEGTPDYPVHVAMETVVVFAFELSRDFIGQYYGAGQELTNITRTDPSDYRRVVMAVLGAISTDSIIIIAGQHLSSRVLGMSIVLTADPANGNTVPSGADYTTYVNGDQGPWPPEANLYVPSIWNLVNAVKDAVHLDLGSYRYGNLYKNATVFQQVIMPNLPPAGTPSSNWSATPHARSFYYGRITPPYQTWAQMLLAGLPVAVGPPLTGLPDDSVMVTTYLCPTYRVKPLGLLLASVFVGSATMITAAWGAWMLFTTILAKWIIAPRVQCLCELCKRIQAKEEEVKKIGVVATGPTAGAFAGLAGLKRRAKPSTSDGDEVPLLEKPSSTV